METSSNYSRTYKNFNKLSIFCENYLIYNCFFKKKIALNNLIRKCLNNLHFVKSIILQPLLQKSGYESQRLENSVCFQYADNIRIRDFQNIKTKKHSVCFLVKIIR